jgi:dihydroorotate dehydrogenase electron transfer subunit
MSPDLEGAGRTARREDDARPSDRSGHGPIDRAHDPAVAPRSARLPQPARVIEVTVDNYRTRTVRLDVTVHAQPGQFAMVWLPGLDEKPFSLLDADPLTVTVAAVGPFSRAVHRLAPGHMVWFRGPLGNAFRRVGRDHLLVGGGYGVAPLLFLARTLLAAGDRVRVVIGARTAADLLKVDAFRALGVETHLATEDGSAGTRGLVTDVVRPMIEHDRPAALYACGPHGMLTALEGLTGGAGLPAQLSWEAYMRCGVGICGSCEHRGLLLCADGPVVEG